MNILKQGVLSERQRSADFEKDIKKYKQANGILEISLNEKENSILLLTKEKYELQSKFDIEKTKLESLNNNSSSSYSNIFRRASTTNGNVTDQEVKKLINENLELKKDVELVKMKYEEKCQDFEKIKNEFHKLINLQIEKIKKCEIIILDKNVLFEENNKKLNQMYENWKVIDIDKINIENKYYDIQKEMKIKDEKITHNEQIIAEK